MKAKKSLGQHFLRSERALKKIIETGEISPEDTILEIGPGTGTLTRKLLETGAKVIAIEKDEKLCESLRKETPSRNLELISGDILEFEPNKLGRYKVIANIPYYLTGAIIKKFLTAKNHPERMVLLVQKEVAKRIIDKKESVLSISVKAYGKPKLIETVKAGSFVPAPKVDSAILLIDKVCGYSKEREDLMKVVKAGFSSKRKKLSSNLSGIFGKDRVQKVFQKINIDENARAEDVPIEIWQKIAERILE